MVGVVGIEVRAARARMRSSRRPAMGRPAKVAAKVAAKVVARVAGTIGATIGAAAVEGPTSGETTAAKRR